MAEIKTYLKFYVEFFYPGAFLSESSTQEVFSKNPHQVKVPENAYAFQFSEILSREVEVQGERFSKSEPLNKSGLYYPDARVYSLDELKSLFPEKKVLIDNMTTNHWYRVVKTRAGSFQPFNKGDTVL